MEPTNSIMHTTLDVMRLIDAADVVVNYRNFNCDVPWQGGGSVASGARWWWAPAECTSPSWFASRPMTALVAFWWSLDWECSPRCHLHHSLPLLRSPPIPASRLLFAPCSWPLGRLLQHFLRKLRFYLSFFAWSFPRDILTARNAN